MARDTSRRMQRAPSPAKRGWAGPRWRAIALALTLALTGCESVSHENIDKWRQTEKGPGKLLDALKDSDESAELRAHAAQNLIQIDRYTEVRDIFDRMRGPEREKIITELAPRLWEDARVDGELTVPTSAQSSAKDALFELRAFANDTTREKIDLYLVDWFTQGYYEGRARSGNVSGAMVMRTVGPNGAPKLLESARSIVARPPDAEGNRPRVGDELLLGLAFTGDPQALAFVVDLIKNGRGDESLPGRALAALYRAYVEPQGLEPANGKALVAVLDDLVEISRDESRSGTMINDSLDLIAAIGLPECLPPFVEMITYAHSQESYRWIGTQRGIRCGGVDAISPVLEALPPASYERGILDKYVWDEIKKIPERGNVAAAVRSLLQSDSWVARASAIEILGALAYQPTAAEDAAKIAELSGDSTILKGWHGPQKDVPPAERKPDPTLGDLARRVSDSLEEVAKGAKNK